MAVHVRVTLYEAPHPGVVTSANVSVKLLPQASVAVAVAKTGDAGHSIVLVAGRGSITQKGDGHKSIKKPAPTIKNTTRLPF